MMRGTRTLALLLAAVALGGSLPRAAVAGSDRQGTLGQPLRSRGYPVLVYFARHPVSDDHYGTVYPLRRIAPTLGVGTFALQQLFAGPTPAEAARGYYTEWPQTLQGPSSCGALGFTLRLNRRGRAVAPGTATVHLCRRTRLGGVGASARMAAQAQATLQQFPTVRRVVLLTAAGACFGDLSGLNRCLRPTSAAATRGAEDLSGIKGSEKNGRCTLERWTRAQQSKNALPGWRGAWMSAPAVWWPPLRLWRWAGAA